MRFDEAVMWLAGVGVMVLLVALDSKSKMTWFGVLLVVCAVVVALYAGLDVRALARR